MTTAGPWIQALATMIALIVQAPPSATGFSFQFTFGPCTLDTSTSSLTYDQGVRLQVPLALTPDDLAAIGAAVDSIDFFHYPSTFIGVPLGLRAYSIDASATSYRLLVERNGGTHAVCWKDSTRPTTEEADALRALFTRIISLIRDLRGLEQLQQAGVECR